LESQIITESFWKQINEYKEAMHILSII